MIESVPTRPSIARFFLIGFALLVALPALVHAGAEKAPIVLVHGFMGWGRDELHGYRYWGGTTLDVEAFLNEKGFPCHTASVGPISSNHDRACELFAQIRGGRVDYGQEHATRFGHARFGRTFPAFHPDWSEENPVHLVGHSMGGQTIRVLVELLARDHFGVGTNGRWVKSVTTIASPHRGTTLEKGVQGLTGGMAETYASWLVALAGGELGLLAYDFDLDLEAWGIEREEGEGLRAFLRRVEKTMGKTKDISSWDLSVAGALELNERVSLDPEVYYFSYGAEETARIPGTNRWIGELGLSPILHANALFMGSHEPMEVEDFADWGQNDGMVNTVSMCGPDPTETIFWEGEPDVIAPGVWNHVRTVDSKDHLKVCGHMQDPYVTGRWLKDFYLEIAERLAGLR